MTRFRHVPALAAAASLLFLSFTAGAAHAQGAGEVDLDRLTTTEVAALQAAGWDTVIIPTGGTEQNGSHLILGKHNVVVHHTAGEIARRLGRTLVAPVIAYVPEGRVDPPEGHMLRPGTISLPEPVFAAVLDAAARSFIATGFRTILFIGDSGGNQAAQAGVASALDALFGPAGIHVFDVDAYYAANGQVGWLLSEGETEASIGGHAGIRETSEMLAIDPSGVRRELLVPGTDFAGAGASGAPDRASAERGKRLLELKIDAALREIAALTGRGP